MPYTTAEELRNASVRYAKRISKVAYRVVEGEAIPVPSLAAKEPGKWTVEKGMQAGADIGKKHIIVPFGNVAAARAIRIEELMHVRHSPVRDKKALAKLALFGVRDDFLQGAEDYRVKSLAYNNTNYYRDKRFLKGIKQTAKLGFRTILATPPNPLAGLTGSCPFPFSDIAYLAMAMYAIEYGSITRSLTYTYVKQYELENSFADPNDPFNFVTELYNTLNSSYKYFKKTRKESKRIDKGTVNFAKAIEEIVTKYEQRNLMPPPPKENNKKEKLEKHETYEGPITPTQLDKLSSPYDVIKLPLTRRLLFNLKTRTVANQGFSIRRIENLHLDPFNPPIFAARINQRVKWPVVLLDASGSMCPSPEEIVKIIKHCPGATIAYYSGSGSRLDGFGKIVVVSEKGYFCEEANFSQHFMGNNIIDWPAINWAINTHPGRPIHWITDQGYTWRKSERETDLNKAVTSFMRAKGVKFSPSVEYFLKYGFSKT